MRPICCSSPVACGLGPAGSAAGGPDLRRQRAPGDLRYDQCGDRAPSVLGAPTAARERLSSVPAGDPPPLPWPARCLAAGRGFQPHGAGVPRVGDWVDDPVALAAQALSRVERDGSSVGPWEGPCLRQSAVSGDRGRSRALHRSLQSLSNQEALQQAGIRSDDFWLQV